jgi:hypothetical protein
VILAVSSFPSVMGVGEELVSNGKRRGKHATLYTPIRAATSAKYWQKENTTLCGSEGDPVMLTVIIVKSCGQCGRPAYYTIAALKSLVSILFLQKEGRLVNYFAR